MIIINRRDMSSRKLETPLYLGLGHVNLSLTTIATSNCLIWFSPKIFNYYGIAIKSYEETTSKSITSDQNI